MLGGQSFEPAKFVKPILFLREIHGLGLEIVINFIVVIFVFQGSAVRNEKLKRRGAEGIQRWKTEGWTEKDTYPK